MKFFNLVLGALLMTFCSAALGLEAQSPARKQKMDKVEPEDISDDEAEAFFQETDAEGITESDIDVFDLHGQAYATQPESEPALDSKEKEKLGALFISGAVVTGLGAATLVGSVVTGTVAMSLDKQIKNNCEANKCEPEYHDTLKRRNKLALTTDVLIGVGSAFTAVGIAFIIVAKVKQAKKHELVINPLLGPSVAGATVKWRF